jgi:hypothetical protein
MANVTLKVCIQNSPTDTTGQNWYRFTLIFPCDDSLKDSIYDTLRAVAKLDVSNS